MALIRVAGLVAVVLISVYDAAVGSTSWRDTMVLVFGVLPLTTFLWLTISGYFGYGSASRRDWVALVPFVVALAVRELFTLHSIQEIEIQFAQGPVGRHSVVYPLFQMFFIPLVRDPQSFIMHLNGVLGALACLGMYLFVRQRLVSRTAGFLCALFLAIHPVVSRFAPTDGPYSLLLAAWFSGLALLSAPRLDGLSMFGGAALVGIAATTRMEGILLLLASVLMLDMRRLIDRARLYPFAASLSVVVVYLQGAVQMYVLLPFHLGGPATRVAMIPPVNRLFDIDQVLPRSYNDRLFIFLIAVGAVAGLRRRFRLGLAGAVAMLVVLVPVSGSGDWAVALHRMVPACALQAMVAGVGAYCLTAWMPSTVTWHWLAVLPGALAASYSFAQHRGDLTKPYVFSEEYGLVRRHLGSPAVAPQNCALMVLSPTVPEDIDIHDFHQVVPAMKFLDCRSVDCLTALSAGGCFYYVRSAAAYYQIGGVPPDCRELGVNGAGDRVACMNEASASFENAVDLQVIEVRTIDVLPTFPERALHYPQRAEVGLFRVLHRR